MKHILLIAGMILAANSSFGMSAQYTSLRNDQNIKIVNSKNDCKSNKSDFKTTIKERAIVKNENSIQTFENNTELWTNKFDSKVNSDIKAHYMYNSKDSNLINSFSE